MTDTADLLDRLGQTALECRALIREMHEADQTLKATIKEARSAINEVRKTVDEAVDADVGAKVREYIDELGEHTQASMRATSQKILTEFDKLAKPLMEAFEDIRQTQARIMGNPNWKVDQAKWPKY